MGAHTAQVQASVQQLVMEHGEYAALELLLATNRLGYDDYRAWCEGRLETLDAVLADGKREIRAWLEEAKSWADVLGLAAEPAVHHGWENNAGAVLVASADPRLNALLSARFRHTREHGQLDLFIDSAQTAAVTHAMRSDRVNGVWPAWVKLCAQSSRRRQSGCWSIGDRSQM